MLFGIPVGELALLAGAILIAGIVSGVMSGLFGIGGSISTAPLARWVKNARNVVGTVTASAVPMLSCIRTSSGTSSSRKIS